MLGRGRLRQLACFDQAALEDGDEAVAMFENADVADDISVDDEHIGEFSRLQCPELLGTPHDFRAGFRCAADRFHG